MLEATRSGLSGSYPALANKGIVESLKELLVPSPWVSRLIATHFLLSDHFPKYLPGSHSDDAVFVQWNEWLSLESHPGC